MLSKKIEGQGHMAIWNKIRILAENLKFVGAESQKPKCFP